MKYRTHRNEYFGVCHQAKGEVRPERIMAIHRALGRHFGPLHWWPGETPFEVCVGAILTQNTAWTNVEKAVANLKRERLLTAERLDAAPAEAVAELIRPSGYFNQKALKLKTFVRFLISDYNGKVETMRRNPAFRVREELLGLKGIGPETADSILLYALGMTVFVIDAYTKRIFHRKGIFDVGVSYEEAQRFFEDMVPADASVYNEFHAQIVNLGKHFCRKNDPRCDTCPVREI